METIYDLHYFIKKFTAIPEHMIVQKALHDDEGGHCSIGWCLNGGYSLTEESQGLQNVLGNVSIADINNGDDPRYQQPTPKQRILQALYDIRAKQQPAEPKEKIIYKTVVIDTAVQKLQKQLTEN